MARDRGHRWVWFALISRMVCWGGCGLIRLRNDASERAARAPCRGADE